LQGLNKAETLAEHGEERFAQWRRSYDIAPPPAAPDSPHHPRQDTRYRDVPPDQLPATECLKDVVGRLAPYWHDQIVPDLRTGDPVLVAAHGNSLRAMVKMLDEVSEAEIVELNIPTGVPLLYDLDARLRPLGRRYLGDPGAIAAAAEAVRRQTEKR